MKTDTGFIRQIRNAIKPNDENFRQKLYVFLVCLLISVIIWFLIMLSNEAVTSLEYPVTFKNLPGDMVLVNKPDSILTFRIASGGFELITLKYLTRKPPVEVDLSHLDIQKSGDQFVARYPTSDLSDMIFRRFSFSRELVSISPENIYFRFEPLDARWVHIQPKINIEYEKSYGQSDSLRIKPDSVKLVGPKEDLAKISKVLAVNDPVKNVDASITIKCDLKLPGMVKNVQIIPDKAEIYIPVEKFTESTIEVPLTVLPSDVKVKTFPATIKILYLVSLKDYQRIDPGMFKAVINLGDSPDKGAKARVKITAFPSFVKINRVEPEEVEYLVIQP